MSEQIDLKQWLNGIKASVITDGDWDPDNDEKSLNKVFAILDEYEALIERIEILEDEAKVSVRSWGVVVHAAPNVRTPFPRPSEIANEKGGDLANGKSKDVSAASVTAPY